MIEVSIKLLPLVILLLACSGNSYPYFPTCASFDSRVTLLSTLNGKIQGRCSNVTVNYASKPKTSTPVLSFLGIPYAEPPIRNLRFKNALPAKPWNNILNGTKLPNRCFQAFGGDTSNLLKESEDCLYLNVFIPYNVYLNAVILKNESFKAPILVWIHGGSFLYGASLREANEPSTFVAMSNVIVVNINYRLGVFGFLYVNGTDANGNQGVFDQNLALKWVFENAKTFGGDNSKITIGGNSAGGYSVGFHLAHKPSWPYFNNAIIESGNLLDYNYQLISNEEASRIASNISFYSNCTRSNSDLTLQCLKSVDSVTLNEIGSYFIDYPAMTLDRTLIQQQPSVSIAKGNFKNANLLIGFNTIEYAFFYQSEINHLNQQLIGNLSFFKELIFTSYAKYPFSLIKRPNTTIFDIIDLYVPVKALSDKKTNYLDYFFQITSESGFKYPAIQLADYQSKINPNVYVYSYGYHISSSPLPSKYEAVHTDELYMGYSLH